MITISAFVRDRAVELLGLDPGRVHVDPPRDRPRRGSSPAWRSAREPFLLYPARRWPHKNHERLFEAFALLRRERPWLRLVLTGGGHVGRGAGRGRGARTRVGGRARRPLPARSRTRLPVAVRGLRPAAGRGDGVRLPGRVLGRGVAAGGRRRRGARSSTRTTPRRSRPPCSTCWRRPEEWSARGLERAKLFSWEATARAHEDVYRELSDQYPYAAHRAWRAPHPGVPTSRTGMEAGRLRGSPPRRPAAPEADRERRGGATRRDSGRPEPAEPGRGEQARLGPARDR